MRVTVKMTGNLRRLLPVGQSSLELVLPPGATAGDVARQLGVSGDEVGLLVVNGVAAEETTALRDGDQVDLLAVMAGGRSLWPRMA